MDTNGWVDQPQAMTEQQRERRVKELDFLRQQAVDLEEFERAAYYRDEIARLKGAAVVQPARDPLNDLFKMNQWLLSPTPAPHRTVPVERAEKYEVPGGRDLFAELLRQHSKTIEEILKQQFAKIFGEVPSIDVIKKQGACLYDFRDNTIRYWYQSQLLVEVRFEGTKITYYTP